jgi:predicted RNase H-like nuclease (RuvC/YqgF family)
VIRFEEFLKQDECDKYNMLQECNAIIQQKENIIKEKDKEIERLKKENNILKENAEHNDKVVDNVNWENMLLKKRISKAIEYIESYMPNYDFDKTNLTKVLDILKGVDKE